MQPAEIEIPPRLDGSRFRLRRLATWLVRLAIGVAIVVAVRRSVDGGAVFKGSGPWFTSGFLMALGFLILATLVASMRWREIIGDRSLSVPYLFRLFLLGQFASVFLPTTVGGDVMRAGLLARRMGSVPRAATSVLLDRLVGVAGLCIIFLIGLGIGRMPNASALEGPHWSTRTVLVVLGGGLAGSGILVAIPAARRRLAALWLDLHATYARLLTPGNAARLMVLAVVVQVCYVGAWAGVARALGLDLPAGLLWVAVPLVSLVALLPISISGLGLRESAWTWLLRESGRDPNAAVALGLTYFAGVVIVGALGACWYLASGTQERGAATRESGRRTAP